MNKDRRAKLQTALETIKEINLLTNVINVVEAAAEEEREAFDNLSEGLQQSERGQAMDLAADALSEACESLEEASGALAEAIAKLEEAIGES